MIIKIIFALLIGLSILSPVVAIIIGLKKRNAFNVQLKALFLYMVISLCVDALSSLLFIFKMQKMPLQMAFAVFEFLIICYLYWLELKKTGYKVTIGAFIVIYIAVFFISYFTSRNFESVLDYISVTESAIIIILALVFLYKIFIDLEVIKLTDYPFFWFNSAFLIYFATTFFLFLFNNNLKEFDPKIVYFLTAIQHLINIGLNVLIAIGLCKVKKI